MTPQGDETWDGHAHVIGDPERYPLWAGSNYQPDPAPLRAYLELLDRLGLARGVLVQPSAYGHDHACMLDTLDQAGGRLVGVAVPHPDATPRDFERLHARGVRGVRCNLLNPGGLAPEIILAWQPVLRTLGWHVALHIGIDTMIDLHTWVRRFEVPVVIDHMGRPHPGHTDPTLPHTRLLIDLVREGACFVKLSAPYRLSDAPPPWSDVTPLARALLEANPDRCLFATDWPHVHTPARPQRDDLVAALHEWCPAPARRSALLSQGCRSLLGLR